MEVMECIFDHDEGSFAFSVNGGPRLHALRRLVATGAWASWMRANLSDAQRDRALTLAHDAASSRLLAYGHLPLDFGDPTDWHRAPASAEPWPRARPHQRVLRVAPEGSDIKDTWALGRAGHLIHRCRGHAPPCRLSARAGPGTPRV